MRRKVQGGAPAVGEQGFHHEGTKVTKPLFSNALLEDPSFVAFVPSWFKRISTTTVAAPADTP